MAVHQQLDTNRDHYTEAINIRVYQHHQRTHVAGSATSQDLGTAPGRLHIGMSRLDPLHHLLGGSHCGCSCRRNHGCFAQLADGWTPASNQLPALQCCSLGEPVPKSLFRTIDLDVTSLLLLSSFKMVDGSRFSLVVKGWMSGRV